jgi:hypothetical protein
MNFASIEKIADAVLFEGYMLYPYRASAIKNRQRWNFGTLYPQAFAEAQSPQEAWSFHAEIMIEGSANTVLDARLRFLQLVNPDAYESKGWNEGVVRSRCAEGMRLDQLLNGVQVSYNFSEVAGEERERVPSACARISIEGSLSMKATLLREGLYRISATLANVTAPHRFKQDRQGAQAYALTSAHLLLHVEGGSFVSLLEPPPESEREAQNCTNRGVFPVLAGDKQSRAFALCSPIILYDYPQVAPESAGDYFDGCEMDEMLALRVLTLTDEEKAEIRRGDLHAQKILARTESLPTDHLLKLHGAVRDLRPVGPATRENASVDGQFNAIQPWNPFDERPPLEAVRVFGAEIRSGDRVRIWPQKKADIMDMALEGKIAVVEAIEQDFEDNIQFAVVLEDDPGRDMGMLRQPGHRFFFHPDEVEPLAQEVS